VLSYAPWTLFLTIFFLLTMVYVSLLLDFKISMRSTETKGHLWCLLIKGQRRNRSFLRIKPSVETKGKKMVKNGLLKLGAVRRWLWMVGHRANRSSWRIPLHGARSRGARFFLVQHTKLRKYAYTKWPPNLPNIHKICQTALRIPNGHKICRNLPFQGPQRCIKIGIFGLQIIPSGNPV
jgi:hypothetical protein